MTYYLFRQHILPMDIPNVVDIVCTWYIDDFQTRKAIMTPFEMNRIIRKMWKRCELWSEKRIEIRVPNRKYQMEAIQAESMDQLWIDIKPKKASFMVHGRISFKKTVCPICMESKGIKIKLKNCTCIFHVKCIQEAVKYNDVCPICQCTINKELIENKDHATTKEKDKKRYF